MVRLRACPEVCARQANDKPEHYTTQDRQHLGKVGCSGEDHGCAYQDTHQHDYRTDEVGSFKRFAFEWCFAF